MQGRDTAIREAVRFLLWFLQTGPTGRLQRAYLREWNNPAARATSHSEVPANLPAPGGLVRRLSPARQSPRSCSAGRPHRSRHRPPRKTDLDAFMERALQRRDTDRKNLSDYVLDEVEAFEVLGAGRAPYARMRRDTPGTSATASTSAARSSTTAFRFPKRTAAPTRSGGSTARRTAASSAPARGKTRAGRQVSRGQRSLDQRAALHLRVLLHGLQVRARKLLPRRQGKAGRQGRPEDRLPADQALRRR